MSRPNWHYDGHPPSCTCVGCVDRFSKADSAYLTSIVRSVLDRAQWFWKITLPSQIVARMFRLFNPPGGR